MQRKKPRGWCHLCKRPQARFKIGMITLERPNREQGDLESWPWIQLVNLNAPEKLKPPRREKRCPQATCQREKRAAHLEKEEREERATCASFGGPLALNLSLLGGGLSPSAHGQRPLWPPLANCVCMHACLHAINCLSIKWGEIV